MQETTVRHAGHTLGATTTCQTLCLILPPRSFCLSGVEQLDEKTCSGPGDCPHVFPLESVRAEPVLLRGTKLFYRIERRVLDVCAWRETVLLPEVTSLLPP